MTGEIQNFDYDINYSFETNFSVWFKAANRERFDWKEEPLNEEEAYDIFLHKYGHHRVT
jgi:hypothetical protein